MAAFKMTLAVLFRFGLNQNKTKLRGEFILIRLWRRRISFISRQSSAVLADS
jgi:hypothetical protein